MPGCRDLTDAEVKAILASVAGPYALRDRAMIVVGLWTGFRIGELLSLRIGDVLMDGQWRDSITVSRRHMKGGDPARRRPDVFIPIPRRVRQALHPWVRRLRKAGTLGPRHGLFATVDTMGVLIAHPREPRRTAALHVQGRTVPMHQNIPEALAPWIVQARSMGLMRRDDYLFQSRARGNRPITVQHACRIFLNALARCGIHGQTGTHMMRKTYAAKVAEILGHNIYLLQQALGHVDVKSTQSYMKSFDREVKEAILNMR
jgi:integrase